MAIAYYHYLEVSGAELLNEDGSGGGIELEDGSGNLLLNAYSYGVEFVSTTQFELTYRVARSLGYLEEGQATSGSTSTLVDTDDRDEDDDYWNGGTVWIVKDQAGAGAAPEGEYAIISDFANSSSTVTFRDALTAAVANNDRYAIADDWVPLHIIISKINEALIDMGPIAYTDTSTITIAADQTEYTLPTEAALNLLQVWLQTEDDSNKNLWREVLNWEVEHNAIGTDSTLILPYQYATAYDLKLVYQGMHPELYDYDDVLSDAVPIERVIYPAIRDCFLWLKQKTRRNDWDVDIQRWENRAELAKATRPILQPKAPAKVMTPKTKDQSRQFLDQVSGID